MPPKSIGRAVLALWAAAAVVAGGMAPIAGARTPAWQDYVPAPKSDDVKAVRIASTSGRVANARRLVGRGRGGATLTMTAGGPEPVIVLDYGKVVGGIPYLEVASVEGTPTLRASFSESGRYIDADGDNGGLGPCCGIAPPAAEPTRFNEWSPTGPGMLRTTYQQGGQRFERIALTTPGTVRLRAAGTEFKAYRATPDKYQGWFLSSDDQLNRLWYAGAYTVQLNMVPPHTQNDNREPVVVDGAKRDRAIWSGDLVVQNPAIWNHLGTNGSEYVKQSLLQIARLADPSGALAGVTRVNLPIRRIYSASYSMHAANTMVDFYRYTGDRAFAEQMLPVVEKQLEFITSQVDERGLLVTRVRPELGPFCCGLDWDIYDAQKTGAVTAYNAIFHHALRQAAYLASHLGDQAKADAYTSRASALRQAINSSLFDLGTGLYRVSDERPDQIAQDANALAVLYGVAPADRVPGILQGLKQQLWTPYGTRPFSENTGFSPVISPFVNSFETAARFLSSDDDDALELMRRLWGIMVRPGIDYSGAFWEKMSPAGTVDVLTGADPVDNQSLAHGWSAGPTTQLSEYLLGVSPVEPGYRSWVVAPHPGDVRWARGQVPTPAGPITVRWHSNRPRTRLRIEVSAPAGTKGSIVPPVTNGTTAVVVDGRPVGAGEPIQVKGGAKRSITLDSR